MKTGEETAIQSLHNGKVKSDARWVGSKGELLFPASVTTRACVCVCGTHTVEDMNGASSAPSAVQWNVKRRVNCAFQVGMIRPGTRILTLSWAPSEIPGNP